MDQIRGAASIGSIKRALRELREAIYSLKEEADPLRVRLVGEIWVLMEPYANLGLEEFLGSRPDLRIWVDREVSPGIGWIFTFSACRGAPTEGAYGGGMALFAGVGWRTWA